MTEPLSYKISVATNWETVAGEWQQLIPGCVATPFQQFDWLDAWYRTLGAQSDTTPVLVKVTAGESGMLVMLLPLVINQRGRSRVLQFADQNLTDFNAPILGSIEISVESEAPLWRMIIAALPCCDAVEIRKMPRAICGRRNPLASVRGAATSSVTGNVIDFPGSWADYHQSIERRVRMELERNWRVLRREPTAKFVRIHDVDEALAAIATMDQQQRLRLTEIGSKFGLDQPVQAAFYRQNLARRLAESSVIVTSLQTGGQTIAVLYAISDTRTAIVLRISHAGKSWSKLSPGRLIVHGTLEALHNAGFAAVDLSVGEYDYKRRFGVVPTPMTDLVAALSWRGQAAAARHWAVAKLRARPGLEKRVRKLLNQISSLSRPSTTGKA